jgi:hypothetical protein
MPDERRARLYKQQSRRRYAANGFAFVAPYVPFSWTVIVGLSKRQ